MTVVEGRVVRAIGLTTFADITPAPLVLPGGVDRHGLLFDGDLTPTQVEAIWFRMTSRDDSDEQARRAMYDLLAPTDSPVVDALVRYALGL